MRCDAERSAPAKSGFMGGRRIITADAIEEMVKNAADSLATVGEAARNAAEAAQRSAKWTMVPGIAAAAGALISAVSTAITAAQALKLL